MTDTEKARERIARETLASFADPLTAECLRNGENVPVTANEVIPAMLAFAHDKATSPPANGNHPSATTIDHGASEALGEIVWKQPAAPSEGRGGEEEALRRRGFGDGLDHIANFINALDSSEMSAKEVRSAIYSECLTAALSRGGVSLPDREAGK